MLLYKLTEPKIDKTDNVIMFREDEVREMKES